MAYALTDLQVLRVLECLRDYRHKSLSEVTSEYNKRYPPSLIRKVIGIKVESQNILPILKFLVEEELVAKELFTFTDRPLSTPEFLYSLTQEGIRRKGVKR